jgi:hypothetical protein
MRLTLSEVSFLAKSFPNTNQLSLFANIKVPVQGTEQKNLEEKGVFRDGRLTEAWQDQFAAVAAPQRCTRFILRNGPYLIEKYAYRSDAGYALAENDGGDIEFTAPESLEGVLAQVSRWIGRSDLKSFDIEIQLKNGAALVLLALIDIGRQNTLEAYLGRETKEPVLFSQLRAQLEKPAPNSLVTLLVKNYGYPVPEIEDTKELLDGLVARKIVSFDRGYTLAPEYGAVASNFLIPQTIVLLEAFDLDENSELSGMSMLCVCAGIKEIVSFVLAEGQMEIVSISGWQMLKIVEDFLGCKQGQYDEA